MATRDRAARLLAAPFLLNVSDGWVRSGHGSRDMERVQEDRGAPRGCQRLPRQLSARLQGTAQVSHVLLHPRQKRPWVRDACDCHCHSYPIRNAILMHHTYNHRCMHVYTHACTHSVFPVHALPVSTETPLPIPTSAGRELLTPQFRFLDGQGLSACHCLLYNPRV